MSTATIRTVLLGLACASLVCLTGCANESTRRAGGDGTDPRQGANPGQDLPALQGRWEQLPDEPGRGAARQRVVKEVKGNSETVTTYGPDGQVVQAQTAQFRLSRSGLVGVYTVEQTKITRGAGEGRAATQAPMSFVYRIHGDRFDEVWGLLPGQEEREVVVKRWRREGAGR